MPRLLVLVTGPPGAGKSTLAPALARELDFPLLMKDTIKEAIHDGLGLAEITLEESQRIGAATYEVIWAVAAHMPEVVIECNFRAGVDEIRQGILRLHPRPVEVYCRCPPEVAAARYRERHAEGARHATHVIDDIPLDTMRRFRSLELGPVVEVDTTAAVDTGAVAALVRGALRVD